MTEAERAQTFRQQLAARAQFRERNASSVLAGDTGARRALSQSWRPVYDPTAYIEGVDDPDETVAIDALLERSEGPGEAQPERRLR